MMILVLVARARQQPMKTIESVKKTVLDNRRITIEEVADDVRISFRSFQAIFMDVLGMKRVAGKIVRLSISQNHFFHCFNVFISY